MSLHGDGTVPAGRPSQGRRLSAVSGSLCQEVLQCLRAETGVWLVPVLQPVVLASDASRDWAWRPVASLHVDPSLTSHQCHASLPARGRPWHCLAAVELFTDWPSGLKGSAPSHCVLSLPSLSSPSMEFCFLNRTRPRERRMSLCEQAIDCQGFSRPAGKEGTQVSLHL